MVRIPFIHPVLAAESSCPEIIIAQHRASRLLRRYTPQQLLFACQTATRAIPAWPASPSVVPHHWRHRLLILQTANQRSGPPADHDAYTQAATYPDVITAAAAELRAGIKAHPAGPE